MVRFFFGFFLRMKNCLNSAPVAQEDEQVLDPHIAVGIQVGDAISAIIARTPGAEKDEQVLHAHASVAVKVALNEDSEGEVEDCRAVSVGRDRGIDRAERKG